MIKCILYIAKFIIIALTALLFSSCKYNIDLNNEVKGSGKITTQTRPATSQFSNIEVHQGIEVAIIQSDSQSVVVKTDDNIQDLITTNIQNGILVIRAKNSYNTNLSPKVTVALPIINGLEANSGSKLYNNALFTSKNLKVKSSSGSQININTDAESLSLESSSGSNITAVGKTLKLETASSSGSSINAKKMLANEVISQASSGSTTDIAPIISLDAKASSGSQIIFHQKPKTITKEESSGGSVTNN